MDLRVMTIFGNILVTTVFGQKCSCKAEWRKVGTTVPVGPCVPVILCAVLTYSDLVAEPKWWMKVVATKEGFEIAPPSFKCDVRKHFVTDKKEYADAARL